MNWHLNSNKNQRNKAKIEHLLLVKHFAYIISLGLTTSIRGRSYHELHFKDSKTKT